MKEDKNITGLDLGFVRKMASASEVDLFACYQCGKCSNGCPVSFAMDYYPHQVIRMVQLGLAEEILSVKSVWLCASCETCFTRCPNEVDLPHLMDYLKQWVLDQGRRPVEGAVAAFHQVFLENIRKFGRIHEVALVGEYLFKTAKAEKKIDVNEMLRNFKLGFQMFKRGRLAFRPRRTEGQKRVKKVFGPK